MRTKLRRRAWIAGAVTLILVGVGTILNGVLSRPHSTDGRAAAVGPVTAGPVSASTAVSSSARSPSPSAIRTRSPSATASPRRRAATSTPGNTGTVPIDPDRPDCGPTPSACGLPDAANTGVPPGTALTAISGNLTITKAGTVVDGKHIKGCIDVRAAKVTIRRTKITCTGYYAILQSSGDGAYTLYCPMDSSTNVRVIGNRITTIFTSKGGEYGPWTYCAKVAQAEGNIWDDTLQPLAAD